MDDATAQELRELRARAYGPGADILSDPEACARLALLEELARRETHPTRTSAAARDGAAAGTAPGGADAGMAGATSPASEAPPRSGSGSSDATTIRDSGPDEEDADSRMWTLFRALTLRVSPLLGTGWALSVVAAALLAASVTWALAALPVISPTTGARQVATLDPDPSLEWPAEFFGSGSESASTYGFFGLLISTTTAFATSGQDCMVIVAADAVSADGSTIEGPLYYGCAAGTFPATVEVPVDDQLPTALRERFEDGTALQFVLDDDRVGVFWDGGTTRARAR